MVLEVENSRYLPSVVFLSEAGDLMTGRVAARQAGVFPQRAERAPKQALAAGSQVVLGGARVPVTDVAAALLRRMYAEAVRYRGGRSPEQVVLTHPARWGDAHLGRLREAAGKAGIADPVLMPEPVAAAWCYARPSSGDLVGVFDLGATLDTAILRANRDRYEVVGQPGGGADLGGEDFDALLLGWISEMARSRDETEWNAVFSGRDPRSGREFALVRQDVTTAKEMLSEYLTYDLAVTGFPAAFRLTRSEFEGLITPLADRAATEMLTTITAAETSAGQLSGLFLTGGSCRIPLIAARLGAKLGVHPQLRDDPKAAVALGALAASDPADHEEDAAAAASGLAMFHAGPDRAGVYPPVGGRAAGRPPGRTPWKYKVLVHADSPFFSSPTVSAGMVFVGSTDAGGSMYALDATTGALRWQHPVAGGVASSPPAAHGMLYFASADCHLYAADLDSGAPRWKFRAGGPIMNSSPAVADRSVYVGCHDGNLYAVDALTGLLHWKFQTRQVIEATAAVADGVVYAGSCDHRFYALDAVSGGLRWAFPTDGHVLSSPAVADGVVYVGSCDRNVYALDAASGEPRWRYATGGWVASSPAVVNGTLYVGSNDSFLYALDSATGNLRWKQKAADIVYSSPAVVAGTVYVGSGGYLYALDSDDGRPRWTSFLGALVFTTPAVADDVVYIGCGDGYLYAVDTANGLLPR
jgi:outer membrane protein assembly factor BamB